MDQSGDPRGRPLTFLEPKGDNIYLYMDLREQKSSIIVTPEVSQQISETGVIIAMGPKIGYKKMGWIQRLWRRLWHLPLNQSEWQIGDRVMIHYYTGTHIQLKEVYSTSRYHRIIREHEILTKINQEERDKFNKE